MASKVTRLFVLKIRVNEFNAHRGVLEACAFEEASPVQHRVWYHDIVDGSVTTAVTTTVSLLHDGSNNE